MKKAADTLQGIALFLILGAALCADGLADAPHGFTILFSCIGAAWVLVGIANRLEAKENRPVYRNYTGRHQRKH